MFIGPFSPPITGNSLVNDKILEILSKDKYSLKVINTSYPVFNEYNGQFSVIKFFYYLKINFKLYKMSQVDLVYISLGQTFLGVLKNGLAMFLAHFFNKEIIAHLHGNELGNNYSHATKFNQIIFKKILGYTDNAIVLSQGLKHNMKHFLKNNQIHILPNFIENKIIGTESEISNKNFREIKLLFLSNLMIEKGVFELLEALHDLQEEGIYIYTEFYGNIDDQNSDIILEKIKNLGKYVHYGGIADIKKKRAAFIRNNVFILPSYNEGMPLSILEAMGTGNMIIVSDLIGLKGILKNDKNAILIKSKNSLEIKKALKEVYCNIRSYKKIGQANYNKAKNGFSEQKFIGGLEKIFDKV